MWHRRQPRTEKHRNDRERQDGDVSLVSFDLQSQTSCPGAEISSFFPAKENGTYEAVSVREANDITRAAMKVLEPVVHDYPDATEIVTWSDSCVPQNRNSVIGFPMADLLTGHPQGRKYIEVLCLCSSIQHWISHMLLKVKRNSLPNQTHAHQRCRIQRFFQAASIITQHFSEVPQLAIVPHILHWKQPCTHTKSPVMLGPRDTNT